MFQERPGFAQYGPTFTFIGRSMMAICAAAVIAVAAVAAALVCLIAALIGGVL